MRIRIQPPALLLGLAMAAGPAADVAAQIPDITIGQDVPRDVRELYDRGLDFLVKTQLENGSWQTDYDGVGPTGLGLMALLSSGEDPNFGLYADNVRRALRYIISSQNAATGYLSGGDSASMYHHGFGMLALAEAYGAVDDRLLWEGGRAQGQRSIGEALELSVRCAVTSHKKNPWGGWRYSPDATDADTSVSGAVLVGLLAARNAGIEVPDENVDKAIKFYAQMTSLGGQVAYGGGLGGLDESMSRIAIGTLVFALAKRKDLPQYKAAVELLSTRSDSSGATAMGYAEYQRYYQAQALFQADFKAWERWNKALIRHLKTAQLDSGCFTGQYSPSLNTSFGLLALALNYRFLPIYER